jgi:hypothetical protein
MLHIDHVSMATRNLFEAADQLRSETGLGYYDGGWNRAGLASRIFPLGGAAYLVLEGIVDACAVYDPDRPGTRRFFAAVSVGEHFRGFTLGVDSLDDLEAIAAQRASRIYPNAADGRMRSNGTRVAIVQTPSIGEAWSRGMPNWCFLPEPATHPSGQKVVAAPGLVAPQGIAWIEAGGSEKQMSDWLGHPASQLPIVFNGRAPGLYAVAVKTSRGEVIIRRSAGVASPA